MVKKQVIAFDIGDKRIGVAVSDPFGEYAMPCETFFRSGKFSEDVDGVVALAKARNVGAIVCGLPVNYDGTPSVQTEKTQRFIDAIKQRTDIPVEIEDERFTTMQARATQIEGGIKRADRKKTVDSIAASYILDGYLAKQREKEKEQTKMSEELLNEEEYEDNVIELEDDEGNSVSFYHVGTIEYKGHWYCFFQKAEPETPEEEDEVVIYLLDGEGEDQKLLPIEDDQLLDEVFAEFCKEYEAYENSEDAKRLDGDE